MILVATGAIVTDLMFFAGSAIFPLCSVVTTGRGFGIDGAVGLVVYYVGFFFAFKYVDKILEQQCPMPPQIKVWLYICLCVRAYECACDLAH